MLWNEFPELTWSRNLDYSSPKAIERRYIIQGRLISQQHGCGTRHPGRYRYGNARLRGKYAKSRGCGGGHGWIGKAGAGSEGQNIHHGLVIHDSGRRLAACHHPIGRQDGELAWRESETACQRCAVTNMIRHRWRLLMEFRVD